MSNFDSSDLDPNVILVNDFVEKCECGEKTIILYGLQGGSIGFLMQCTSCDTIYKILDSATTDQEQQKNAT